MSTNEIKVPDLETAVRRALASEDKEGVANNYGLKPTDVRAKTIDKLLPGIRASQYEVEQFYLNLTPPPTPEAAAPLAALPVAPAGEVAASMAPPVAAQPPTPVEQPEITATLADSIGKLASRVRVAPGASPEEVLQAILAGQWTRRVVMLMPTYDDVNPNIMFTFLAAIRKQPWLGFEMEHGTVLQRSRNVLADRFLKGTGDWSLWVDSDMALPFRDPGYFYGTLGADQRALPPQFLDVNAAERLGSSGKTLIGAVYHQRKDSGEARLVIQPHLHPTSPGDQELVRSLLTNGPRNQVIPVGYVATGCAMVHRSVYLDIMAIHPERVGVDGIYDFFGHDVGSGGEDIAFCRLAREAGHQPYLDLGLWCGHVGNKCFFPPRLGV